MNPHVRPTRRGLLAAASAGVGLLAVPGLAQRACAGAPFILKPLPSQWFVDFGTNAEMRWDSVTSQRYLTPQNRLFVRDNVATPTIDASTYRLKVFGDGLRRPRTADQSLPLSYAELRRMPRIRLTTVS